MKIQLVIVAEGREAFALALQHAQRTTLADGVVLVRGLGAGWQFTIVRSPATGAPVEEVRGG